MLRKAYVGGSYGRDLDARLAQTRWAKKEAAIVKMDDFSDLLIKQRVTHWRLRAAHGKDYNKR